MWQHCECRISSPFSNCKARWLPGQRASVSSRPSNILSAQQADAHTNTQTSLLPSLVSSCMFNTRSRSYQTWSLNPGWSSNSVFSKYKLYLTISCPRFNVKLARAMFISSLWELISKWRPGGGYFYWYIYRLDFAWFATLCQHKSNVMSDCANGWFKTSPDQNLKTFPFLIFHI